MWVSSPTLKCYHRNYYHSCWTDMFNILIIASMVTYTSSLKIKEFSVPSEVSLRDTHEVILDCDYHFNRDTKGFGIKWFFDDNIIYQWIPPAAPEVLGILKDRIDRGYIISHDPLKRYRAIKINDLGFDLSGSYKCEVFTYHEEDNRNGTMMFYVPPKTLETIQDREDEGASNISCSAVEFYPEGKLQFHRKTSGKLNAQIENLEIDTTVDEKGLYTATAFATVNDSDFPRSSLFECVLLLPGTSFVYTTSLLYSNWNPNLLDKEITNEIDTSTAPVTEASLFVMCAYGMLMMLHHL